MCVLGVMKNDRFDLIPANPMDSKKLRRPYVNRPQIFFLKRRTCAHSRSLPVAPLQSFPWNLVEECIADINLSQTPAIINYNGKDIETDFIIGLKVLL